ncbi:ATP-binding cassette domain-containing protein [Paramuribaculum intestinale]|uniref:ATP-binding cassette domain-containing protein n=1 Tax=Paramuribaculum intestinale TaxID=2094151 RepID=UPI0025A9BE4F|nr:ABC transporter ATP-binding protein [Paramuribaculum intestinale]
MITFNNLCYRYPKDPEALSDITAAISPGIHLLLGENGTGKTTLLHIIAGLLYPTAGSVEVDGMSPRLRQPALLEKIFFLGDDMTLPGGTALAFAHTAAKAYAGFDAGLLADYLARFGLTGRERLDRLSLGNRRKSLIAVALALRTQVLLLDEPANGLDIGSKETLGRMLAEAAGDDRTIIVSTHVTHDFHNIFDGVIALRRNRLQLAATLTDILSAVAFTAGMIPPVEAIFTHQSAGLFRSITAAGADTETDIDYNLLYMALQSDRADIITSLINSHRQQQP